MMARSFVDGAFAVESAAPAGRGSARLELLLDYARGLLVEVCRHTGATPVALHFLELLLRHFARRELDRECDARIIR